MDDELPEVLARIKALVSEITAEGGGKGPGSGASSPFPDAKREKAMVEIRMALSALEGRVDEMGKRLDDHSRLIAALLTALQPVPNKK